LFRQNMRSVKLASFFFYLATKLRKRVYSGLLLPSTCILQHRNLLSSTGFQCRKMITRTCELAVSCILSRLLICGGNRAAANYKSILWISVIIVLFVDVGEQFRYYVDRDVAYNSGRSKLDFKLHYNGRSQWPRCLRRGSAAARFLGWGVRVSSIAWKFVACECCVLSSKDLCVGLIIRPEESYRV
jgi:hypothetical protein